MNGVLGAQTSSARNSLVIEALGQDDAWRLCDGRVGPRDAEHVIGYAERTAGGFDVVWLCGAEHRGRYDVWESVIAAAEWHLSSRGTSGATRPIRIASKAPRRA